MTRDELDQFTGGDRVAAEELRRSLRAIAEARPGSEVGRLADDVLKGRRTLRQIVREPAFAALMTRGLDQMKEAMDEMSDEERRAMAEEGRRSEVSMQAELGVRPGDPDYIDPDAPLYVPPPADESPTRPFVPPGRG